MGIAAWGLRVLLHSVGKRIDKDFRTSGLGFQGVSVQETTVPALLVSACNMCPTRAYGPDVYIYAHICI